MSFTGFLFGNVNKEGELEEGGVLDKSEVAQLSRLGIVNVDGVMEKEEEEDEMEEEEEQMVTSVSSNISSAEDFADINELAEDEEVGEDEKKRLYQKGMMFVHSKTSVQEDDNEYDEDYDECSDDKSKPTESIQQTHSHTGGISSDLVSQSEDLNTINLEQKDVDVDTNENQLLSQNEIHSSHGHITKPPQLMEQTSEEGSSPFPDGMTREELYEKVKKLFPGFEPNGILCFSSLLGVGKPSSLPRAWEGCQKPKRKKKTPDDSVNPDEWTFNFGPTPTQDMLDDQVERFLAPVDSFSGGCGGVKSDGGNVIVDEETSEWRFGPARVWYDMYGFPEDGRGFDYGFKVKSQVSVEDEGKPVTPDEGKPPSDYGDPLPDDAFLMVTQLPWENNVIYDMPSISGTPRTAQGGFWTTVDTTMKHTTTTTSSSSGLPVSLFPIDNPDLLYRRWENDIIWDSEAVSLIPKPSLARLDPNDPNMIIGIPDEPVVSMETTTKDGKKDTKKSKNWSNNKYGKSGDPVTQNITFSKKDPFNLSNDEYYNPKHATSSQGLSGIDSNNVVQHSTPALDLHPPWFPTHWSAHALRHFHRPRLKIKTNGNDTTSWIVVSDLHKHIAKKQKERDKERIASGGGEVFFMRTPEDLSACDGHVIIAEYSEEHPPLIMATGMATKVKNYYRRPEKIKSGPPSFAFGETTYIQNTSYFLGNLKPGQSLQSFENNLFRAPIYLQVMPDLDFLAIRSENKYHIREVNEIFVVGQECPKVGVPAPNSKQANQFQKEYLQEVIEIWYPGRAIVELLRYRMSLATCTKWWNDEQLKVYLYRLFQESDDIPKKLKMEMVRRAFPASVMSESVIRKVLKQFADFKREGYESGSWVLRSDVRLPTEEEMRVMVTPEQTCAYFSMLAAEQRLKDAGYGGKSLFAVEDDEEEDSSQKIDDEVRAAPWNTTHHFINAMKGKYQLSVSGPADPTGCGEGFSYTRLNPKDSGNPGISSSKRPKSVMGTEADLRKLKLKKARNVLRNFGVPEDEINKLSRWKVIDLVRTISTEAAKSGGAVDVNSLMFARGTRFSQMEAQEKYKEDCQRVFELQNKVLSSSEVLSTDEESSDSGGESEDELGRNLESLLSSKKTAIDLSHEQEEAERQDLRRLLMEDQPISNKNSNEAVGDQSDRATPSLDVDDTSSVLSFSSFSGRRLVISRTFKDEGGREYVRHEVVKNQGVIDAYVRIMSGSKDKDIRMEFAEKDEQTRDDIRKEVKRLQHALRQLDRQEEKAKNKPQKPKKEKFTAMHLTCSACGQKGHMKTNKNCPMYKNQPVQVALTDADLQAQNDTSLSQDDLVKVEGTKVVLKKDLVERAEDVRRKSLVLRFPKEKVKKKRRHGDEQLDYLEKRAKSGQRRRTNPEVPFAATLEKVVNKLSSVPEVWPFCKPVSAKTVPDYYNLIKFPMDLQTMKDNIRKHKYETREQFWEQINLIVNNCITYNGFNSELTRNVQKMLEICNGEMKMNDKELEQLEHEINPLLGDDPLAALSFLLRKCVEKMILVPNSRPFHFPVNSKKLPDYHIIIAKPMDLETLRKNCESDKYHSREEFIADLNQIVDNSITYNGPTSPFTQIADNMRQCGLKFLEEESDHLSQYESQFSSREISKSPTTSSIHDSSNDVLDQGSILMSEDEGDSNVTVEGPGVNMMTVTGGESMVLESGQVRIVVSDEIDVEGLEEMDISSGIRVGEGEIDQLMQDLQHSSSSEDEDEDEEKEESDIDDV